jgi:hypothetical protein
VNFSSLRPGASHSYSETDSRLAGETKRIYCSCHLTYRVDPPARSARIFTGQKLTNVLYQYVLSYYYWFRKCRPLFFLALYSGTICHTEFVKRNVSFHTYIAFITYFATWKQRCPIKVVCAEYVIMKSDPSGINTLLHVHQIRQEDSFLPALSNEWRVTYIMDRAEKHKKIPFSVWQGDKVQILPHKNVNIRIILNKIILYQHKPDYRYERLNVSS